MHLNYLGPVSCFSPSVIPFTVHHQWLMVLWLQHPLFIEMANDILLSIDVLLIIFLILELKRTFDIHLLVLFHHLFVCYIALYDFTNASSPLTLL